MVFQSFNLFPHRTAIQNVMEAPIHVLGMTHAAALERARSLLERVGLSDRMNALPRQLSGGQQQRDRDRATLAMEPKAILFDEPTSALDPRMTAEVLTVMTDLASDGLTMIVVTHAMQFARRVAHRVHVFDAGNVIESGPPAHRFSMTRKMSLRAKLLSTASKRRKPRRKPTQAAGPDGSGNPSGTVEGPAQPVRRPGERVRIKPEIIDADLEGAPARSRHPCQNRAN